MDENQNRPRVLATTVGSWSNHSGSDTMSVLMSQYGAEKVAALYIRADKSDSKSASRYFHIFEGRVMKSILHPSVITGEEFVPEDLREEDEDVEWTAEVSRYQKFRKHRLNIFLFAREFVWMLGRWKSKELKAFLDDYKPGVLVCPIESYIHFNTINKYIIKRCSPRVIGILWDDNFTYKQVPNNIGHQIHRAFLRHSVRSMVKKCDMVYAFSPKMKEECDKEFGIDSQLLTKPIFNSGAYQEYEVGAPIKMLYTGNLYVGRSQTIMAIAEALREINKEEVKIQLDIYTKTELSEAGLARINIPGVCQVHKPIPQTEVFKLQKASDVLLYVESLERKKNQGARLSFSTKITDYYRAGKCIWAVGSPTLGPIDYLGRTDSALMSYDKQSILSQLQKMVGDKTIITEYSRKGFETGLKNHDGEMLLKRFYDSFVG